MDYRIPDNENPRFALPPGLRGRVIPGKGTGPKRPPKKPPIAPVKAPPPVIDWNVTPDYSALLTADPQYQSLRASTQAQVAQAASRRAAALRGLLMQYGGTVGNDTYGDFRDLDKELAAENPFSALKQLGSGYEAGVRGMRRSLGARGALRSGELGHSQGQLDADRAQAEYDTAQQFLQAMSEAIGAYQGEESQFYGRESELLQDISGRIALANPVQKGKAKYDAALTKRYGQLVYRDAEGNLWTPGGNGAVRFTPPNPGDATIGPLPGTPGYLPPGLRRGFHG